MLKRFSTVTRQRSKLSSVAQSEKVKKFTTMNKTKTKTKTVADHMLTTKSKSINFVMCLLTIVCMISALVQATNGFKAAEVNNNEGRKLFGGYRITPKHCRATKTLSINDPRQNGPTICMFNHECAQRNGEVVGACMDGFLFGACCQIPDELDLESTLFNEAQNPYYQQHLQQKFPDEYGSINQAVAQSYETYGEHQQQQHQQQQSQEIKYSAPTFKPKPKPRPQYTSQKTQQQQQYKPELPKPIYSNLESTRPANTQQPPLNSYTQANIDKLYQQLDSDSGSTIGNSYEAQKVAQDSNTNNKYSQAQDSSSPVAMGPSAAYGDSVQVTSAQSSSIENEKDSQLQLESQSRPVKVPFTAAQPSAVLNDDFVLGLLSTTLPPSLQNDPAPITPTGLPMRIVNGLTEPNSSSESVSFEELPATHNPMETNGAGSKGPKPQQVSRPKPKPRPQKPRPRPPQQQASKPQKQTQPAKTQNAQKQKPAHQQQQDTNSDGEFTHSGITHPGADADLIENDLQFSTGYGPQPQYVEALVRQPSPISYNPSSTATTITSTYSHAVEASKNPANYAEPTTGTSITTHVDSIESIILQLNGTTNHGPTYNIISQQAAHTAAYGLESDNNDGKYEPTTGSSSYDDATSNYYDEVETKRPNDHKIGNEQSDANLNGGSPQTYGPMSTGVKQPPSHSYVSKPTDATDISSPSTVHSYTSDMADVLDEHTMPSNNYNDELQASSHSTHEFNKMPAMGIAYPVDMSNAEEDESSIANKYDVETQKPQIQNADTSEKVGVEGTNENNNAQIPIIKGKPQRPITSNTQNNNELKLPTINQYNDVPQEVSVSSHTTKVQDIETSSSFHQISKPDSITTLQSIEETTLAQRPSISKGTTVAYLTPTKTPVSQRPQQNTDSTGGTSTVRPISGIITSSGTRPRPKPRPKPSTSRPNNKKTKPSTANRPATTKPLSSINKSSAQAANNYDETQGLIKNPSLQQTQAQQTSIYVNKKPAQQPATTYSDSTQTESGNVKRPTNVVSTRPQSVSNPQNKPSKQSVKQSVKQPASTYQENKPTYIKRPTKPTTHILNAEPVYQRPEQEDAVSHMTNGYNEDEHTPTEIYEVIFANEDTNLSADIYGQEGTKVTSEDYGQNYDKPDATYDEQNIKAPQPTFDPEAYYPPPKPSISYDQGDDSESTNRPILIRNPSAEQPSSNKYSSAVPTSSRPMTTVIYHDSQVPPIVMADDKLETLAQNTMQTDSGAHPSQSNYQGQIQTLDVKPQYAERPQYTYVHKKPGFVRVTSKPITTINGIITPKPTLFTLVTTNKGGWSQRPSSLGSTYNDNAYPPTTPLPALSSTSFAYSPVVTRRPDILLNVPEYASLSGVTSHDFDDPGYYGAQNIGQNVHPAFTQSIADAEYGVPSDDRPAFPGYYGPTPTYPPFPIPGEKVVGVPVEEETYTSPNDFVNFPPVRNPNLNMSATSSAVTTDLELSTPSFVEDGVLKDKMNTLVHKIVESLQGNFDALADLIDDVNNTAAASPSVGTYQAEAAGAVSGGAVTTRKPARKPTRISSSKPTTKRPVVTRTSTKQPTRRPSASPASTQRPVNRRTTVLTSRKPTTRKPSRRPTTTTTTQSPTEDDLVDEEDEEDVNPADNEIGSAGGGVLVSQDEGIPGAGGRKFKCGVRPHIKSGRIVGGKGSTFGAYPWQVLVRESTWLGLFTKNKCGGVLITKRYVITAAHCQPGFLASLVAVMGEFDISGDLESKRSLTKNVKRVIVHRQYDPATFENDLALLELDSAVQFDTHIVPICMPNDHADFTGRMATVTGWGRLKYGGGVPSVLQEVQVPIIENSVCQEMFHTAGHNKKILGSFLCAGYANGQKDSCEGDSGGPLVLQRPDGRYELAGTVSHGIKCAAPYLPGVYMRTTFYKPWLRSITGVK